ncbi:putative toxin-antitoxin system antitoxin component [Secundilactobacillus oryzae JCM 18671]|uniref:Putative toxin-antitoxin system antitoxin component n=1 Tax=Secundilactobacillus oryzae JCM 18671 TaxID=1291743 RepID=A0A081BGW5_9LACO|nr:type II toxin-antitoxin system RelB/DinJ family antitoxin [Secundilactobacillus oryzae]GAK47283.1 putative toxin-antitoxin system antitoxin component [Secundilactobacillus oryzae JCM 18671]
MSDQIHFRMEEKEKQALETILKQSGLTASQAFKLFAKKTIASGGLPFEVAEPNSQLTAAINSRDYVAFDSAEEGLKWLHE